MPTSLRHLLCAFTLVLIAACQSQQQDNTQDQRTDNIQSSWWSHWPWQPTEIDHKTAKKQHKISLLLEKGALAFSKDRLDAPRHDNALLYYYAVLKLDPTNKIAHNGLNDVAGRYRSLARTAHDNGNAKQMRNYLLQAEMVSGANDPDNIKLRKDLQETPTGSNPRELDNKEMQKKIKARKEQLKQKYPAIQQDG